MEHGPCYVCKGTGHAMTVDYVTRFERLVVVVMQAHPMTRGPELGDGRTTQAYAQWVGHLAQLLDDEIDKRAPT